jgi:hypothetical protein
MPVVLEITQSGVERELGGGKHASIIEDSPHEYVDRPHSFIFARFGMILKLEGGSL